MSVRHVVMVGGGLASAHAAEELRALGYDGAITIIGAEPHPPYERPPLSKGILLGESAPDSTHVHPVQWYADNNIELITGRAATDLDLAARQAEVGDRRLDYDRLLLATGSRPRRLAHLDGSGADVLYLRTLEDSLTLRDRLAGRLLIVGAGWIGLEVAAAARAAGGTVTLVEAADAPLAGVLGQQIAAVFADLHREHGVDLRTATTITAVKQEGQSHTVVRLSDQSEHEVDTILVGIGAEPNIDLATSAGLATGNGILVDACLRSSDANVYAAGDVAQHDHPGLGPIRVEHWDNAIEQGRHAARAMLGDTTPYTRQPYFFSDQYDLGMEYVGHLGGHGYDDVRIRGDLASRTFTAWWIRDDLVVAAMHANEWDAGEEIRGQVGSSADALPGPF